MKAILELEAPDCCRNCRFFHIEQYVDNEDNDYGDEENNNYADKEDNYHYRCFCMAKCDYGIIEFVNLDSNESLDFFQKGISPLCPLKFMFSTEQ